jgi:hypothetical protein
MTFSHKKKNKGFVILFAVTISAMLLAISLGVSNVALKQFNFSTSSVNANNSFFAADTGAECALSYDKYIAPRFTYPDTGTPMTCAGSTFTPTFAGDASNWSYSFTIPNLGSNDQSCSKVVVLKSLSGGVTNTDITSKGYNIGDSACASTNLNRTEREVIVSYASSGVYTGTSTDGVCAATHYDCSVGTSTNNVENAGSYTWSCWGEAGGNAASCSEIKTVATGGTVTTSGGYTIHTFTSNGNFVVANGSVPQMEVLLVGGGGGGGSAGATTGTGGSGGGGGGGMKEVTGITIGSGTYAVVVGVGGTGAPNTGGTGVQGGDGGASSALGQSVSGGGGGGGYVGSAGPITIGRSGGSGGGGGGNGSNAGGARVVGEGGNGRPAISIDAGGGGGKSNATPSWGSAGIAGASSSYSGSAVTYAGGGGGGANQPAGNLVGGAGGGGMGSSNTNTSAAVAGTNGLGGGGGGGYGQFSAPAIQSGKNGGSGIVIIRYLTP